MRKSAFLRKRYNHGVSLWFVVCSLRLSITNNNHRLQTIDHKLNPIPYLCPLNGKKTHRSLSYTGL